MKRLFYFLVIAVSGALTIAGCQSTTAGGATDSSRNQLMLVSASEINQGAALAYKNELDKARSAKALNSNATYTKRVKQISSRLIAQVGVFRPDAKDWKWEVNVFNSNEINAYCMPGGKIGVYTGIITKLQLTDDELAAVIGHEIAHALREHSREQVSQKIASDQAISLASQLGGLKSTTKDMATLTSKYVLELPFSRTMETESDIMGMELMARAGFNPEAAPNVWRKMAKLSDGNSPPEFLSTHPSGASRIENLEKALPKVMPLYEAAVQQTSAKGKTRRKKQS